MFFCILQNCFYIIWMDSLFKQYITFLCYTIAAVKGDKPIKIQKFNMINAINGTTGRQNDFNPLSLQLFDCLMGRGRNLMCLETYKRTVYIEKDSYDCRVLHNTKIRFLYNPYLCAMDHYSAFFDKIRTSIQQQEFIKISLGDYNGTELYLKNVYIKPVIIKREKKLSFVFRYKTQDITKNFELQTGIMEIQGLLKVEGFRVATLFTETENLICQCTKKGVWSLKKENPTAKKPVVFTHDKQKERKLDS